MNFNLLNLKQKPRLKHQLNLDSYFNYPKIWNQRERHTEPERDRDTASHRETERATERDRASHRDTERDTERTRDTETSH